MSLGSTDEAILAALRERVGKIHLRQRLGIETDYERRIFGQGRTFFHVENWYALRSIIRNSLRLVLMLGRGRRNARRIVLRHNPISLPRLPRAFENYRILQISDLHLDMAPDFPHALIEAVRRVDYDLCVLTGDYRAETFGPYAAALDALRQVRTHLRGDVYAILGNHDTLRMVPAIEAMDIRMLLNEQVKIERQGEVIHLAGIDDPHYFCTDNIEEACRDIPADTVSLLLAHSPEIYRHAAHAGFDMLLCGHTHGGQIRLPGGFPLILNARCPRRYCGGAWRYAKMQGYTSLGTGSSVAQARFNCPPEITLHRLERG